MRRLYISEEEPGAIRDNLTLSKLFWISFSQAQGSLFVKACLAPVRKKCRVHCDTQSRVAGNGMDLVSFKLVLIGDTDVGKSSLLIRFADDAYSENFISTIGVDFRFRTVRINKTSVKLQIWDTAGQERFRAITAAYYRGSNGIILVYDVANNDSFDNCLHWINEVKKYAPHENIEILLVGNKCDRADRAVPYSIASKFAQSMGIGYLETSAKTNLNIDAVFHQMAASLLKKGANSNSIIKKGDSITSKETYISLLEAKLLQHEKCC